jgi:putative Holliday junction resolvase
MIQERGSGRKKAAPFSAPANACVILARADVFKITLPDRDNNLSVNAPVANNGRLLAFDLGARRVGVAVSDELRLTVRPLPALRRSSWKQLLREIKNLREQFDARGVVIGLPLRLDGTEGDAAQESRRIAHNLELSLDVPIFLQDERLTSHEAETALRAEQISNDELKARLDSTAAAIILRDFLAEQQPGGN